jgi:hypothetical protein
LPHDFGWVDLPRRTRTGYKKTFHFDTPLLLRIVGGSTLLEAVGGRMQNNAGVPDTFQKFLAVAGC